MNQTSRKLGKVSSAGPGGKLSFMCGFDRVLVAEEKVTLNEVYTHPLKGDPRA